MFQPKWELDSHLFKEYWTILKIYFLNNVISNLKTALDSLHFFCNEITDKSQMFSWDSFDDSKVTKLAPECQVFSVNYGYMLTLLFYLHENMVFCNSNFIHFPDLYSCLR